MKPKRKIISVTDCSENSLTGERFCEHTGELPIISYISPNTFRKSFRNSCPEHKGPLVHKISVCITDGCDKITKSKSPKGKVPYRCAKCEAKEKVAKNARAYQRKKAKAEIQKPKAEIKIMSKKNKMNYSGAQRINSGGYAKL